MFTVILGVLVVGILMFLNNMEEYKEIETDKFKMDFDGYSIFYNRDIDEMEKIFKKMQWTKTIRGCYCWDATWIVWWEDKFSFMRLMGKDFS